MSSLWDENRYELEAKIEQLSRPLAELYRTAIDTLDSSQENLSSASAAIVGHCMRELMNNLFEAMRSDRENANRSSLKSAEDRARKNLMSQWEKCVSHISISDELEDVRIPREVAIALRDYWQEEKDREESNNRRLGRLLLGKEVSTHPAFAEWRSAQKYFVGRAHGAAAGRSVEKEVMLIHIKMVENCISSRLGLFFNVASEIDEILGVANTTAEEYVKPDEKQVQQAVLSLSSQGHRRLFFGKLGNPHWVSALSKKDYFKASASEADENPGLWPEGQYLIRMASSVPDDVESVLSDVLTLDSHSAIHTAIQCLPRLPINKGRTIENLVKKIAGSGVVVQLSLDAIEALSSQISRLLRGSKGEQSRGRSLLFWLFSVRESNDAGEWERRPEPVSSVPECYYGEFIALALEGVEGPRKARYLKRLAMIFDEVMCKRKGALPSDLESHYYRPEIKQADDYSQHKCGNSLIDAYRDVLIEECAWNAEVLNDAWGTGNALVCRIVLYALRRHIEMAIDSQIIPTEEFVELVQSIADNAAGLLGEYDPELYPFLKACGRWEGSVSLAGFYNKVSDYRSRVYHDALSKPFPFGYQGEDKEEYANRYADIEEYKLLSLIGSECLSEGLRGQLERHRRTLGATSFSARIGPSVTVDVEFSSPLSSQEIIAMQPDKLAQYLIKWEPEGTSLDEPSKYGLSVQLHQAASLAPSIAAGVLSKLSFSEKEYINRVLLGLSSALEANIPVPVDEILLALEAWLSDGSPDCGILSSGIRVLSQAIQKSQCGGKQISKALDLFIKSYHVAGVEDDENRWINNLGEVTDVALNALRPLSLMCIADMAAYASDEILQKEALEAFIDIAALYESRSVASAVGLSLGRIIDANEELALSKRDLLFGDILNNNLQCLAFDTALRMYRYSKRILDYLCPVTEAVLNDDANSTQPLDSSAGFIEPLGNHLLNGYLSGDLEYEDPLIQLWLCRTNASQRASLLNMLCHWGGSEDTPAHILERIKAYWDFRADAVRSEGNPAELTGVFSLAHNPSIEMRWLIPRMRLEVSLMPHPEDAALAFERLADASADYPAEILGILMELYESSTESDYLFRHRILDAAIPSIAHALDLDSEGVIAKAKDFMNRLGEAGFIELDKQVHAYQMASEE